MYIGYRFVPDLLSCLGGLEGIERQPCKLEITGASPGQDSSFFSEIKCLLWVLLFELLHVHVTQVFTVV